MIKKKKKLNELERSQGPQKLNWELETVSKQAAKYKEIWEPLAKKRRSYLSSIPAPGWLACPHLSYDSSWLHSLQDLKPWAGESYGHVSCLSWAGRGSLWPRTGALAPKWKGRGFHLRLHQDCRQGERKIILLERNDKNQVVRETNAHLRMNEYPTFMNRQKYKDLLKLYSVGCLDFCQRHLVQLHVKYIVYMLMISLTGYTLWLGIEEDSMTEWPLGLVPNQAFGVIEGSNYAS